MGALRRRGSWPRVRATTPKRVACSKHAWNCGAGSAIPSTSRPRFPPSTLARLQAGDIGGAEQSELEALRIFREVGDKLGEAICLLHLGQICQRSGKDVEAHDRLHEGLAVAEQIQNKEVEAECQLVLGELAYDAGLVPESESGSSSTSSTEQGPLEPRFRLRDESSVVREFAEDELAFRLGLLVLDLLRDGEALVQAIMGFDVLPQRRWQI